jgi:hypothetical protein
VLLLCCWYYHPLTLLQSLNPTPDGVPSLAPLGVPQPLAQFLALRQAPSLALQVHLLLLLLLLLLLWHCLCLPRHQGLQPPAPSLLLLVLG